MNYSRFEKSVEFELIKDLSYFDRFTSVRYLGPDLRSLDLKFPSYIEEIHIESDQLVPIADIRFRRIVIEYLGRRLNRC